MFEFCGVHICCLVLVDLADVEGDVAASDVEAAALPSKESSGAMAQQGGVACAARSRRRDALPATHGGQA